MKLELSKIRLDGGTQPRAALRTDVIDEYAELMKAGTQFDPVTVFFDGTDYWLSDGFHRIGAAKRAGLKEIEAEVHQGSLLDAQWHSYSVNKAHGLRRTPQDRTRAIKAALRHPNGTQRSDREIAAHVGVSPSTVAKHRAEMASTVQTGQSAETTANPAEAAPATVRLRTGRDGRTINTARIGKSPRRKAHRPRSPAELVEARKNGYRGRLPSMVKLELPNNHVHNCAYDLLRYFTFEYLQKVFQEIVHIHQSHLQEENL
jgi:hypothetical protein